MECNNGSLHAGGADDKGQRSSVQPLMGFYRRWRDRIRCLRHTGGMHELDIALARCRFCKAPWATLYPHDRQTQEVRADRSSDGLATKAAPATNFSARGGAEQPLRSRHGG